MDAWCTPKEIRAGHLVDQLAGLGGDPVAARLANDHVIDASKSQLCRDGASAGPSRVE